MKVSEAIGCNIVMGCGHDVEEYQFPENQARTVDDFAAKMVTQLQEGLWGTAVRAGADRGDRLPEPLDPIRPSASWGPGKALPSPGWRQTSFSPLSIQRQYRSRACVAKRPICMSRPL